MRESNGAASNVAEIHLQGEWRRWMERRNNLEAER
jgi:hypothetical protein